MLEKALLGWVKIFYFDVVCVCVCEGGGGGGEFCGGWESHNFEVKIKITQYQYKEYFWNN